MAYPIKAIPTLYGEEASRFQEMADETERKYDISPKRDIKKDPRYRARGCNLNCVKACS